MNATQFTKTATGADTGVTANVPLLGNRVDRYFWNGSTLGTRKTPWRRLGSIGGINFKSIRLSLGKVRIALSLVINSVTLSITLFLESAICA